MTNDQKKALRSRREFNALTREMKIKDEPIKWPFWPFFSNMGVADE